MNEDQAYAHARRLDELDRITFDAVCECDDTYGDYPWCPACYPQTRLGRHDPDPKCRCRYCVDSRRAP